MLLGGYQHNIDKKGRIFIPAKFRDDLGDSFMICRGIYGKRCLNVYSLAEWDKLVTRIKALPNAKSSQFKRFLFEGTFNVDFDSQGRILIPASLREYARLEGEAHLIGMESNVEIWNTDLWNAENEQLTPELVFNDAEEMDF